MNEPYAVAIVVGREAPVSSHLGDRAIVHADGWMEGFVGGACSREIVRRHALETLRTGEPRLVRIRPDVAELRVERDVVTVPMKCISEGAVDVFIEPHLARRELLVAGFTPVAGALAHLAPALGFRVVRFVDAKESNDCRPAAGAFSVDFLAEYVSTLDSRIRERSVAIVASQGHYDETALHALLQADFAFVGLLASRKRAQAIVSLLLQQGVSPERAGKIANPVGLDIGARKPAEVAVSILAEIIARHERERDEEASDGGATAVDPVCGMNVEMSSAPHRAQAAGDTYYFCGAHCRAAFAANPDAFTSAPAPS